ncbi:MAG: T9SS type A sorting domain-containing protein [Flavobacteriia bacterium]|nr:T9SS type A sorting domain-containing protein [Flavobacteriia bacterium]
MKLINTLGIISLFFLSNSILSQTKVDPANCREGESVEYCTTHKKMKALLQNPEALKMYNEGQAQLEQESNEKKGTGVEKGTIYKIPVVFHVLHIGGIENISRDQILDQLSILNRDYRLQNADANNVQSPFQGMPADIEIEFVLATKAPNGQCFNGVTRTQNALSYDGADGGAQADAIQAGNDVYQGNWASNKYLNVFICGEIGGAAGYTMNPSNWGGNNMSNGGIWILHNYVGSIGTSDVSHSRALTHEIGHWLNLSHTWGPNNNPGNTSSCGDDDSVDDTPICIGVTSCAIFSNSCDDLNPSPGITSSWTTDVVDNVENYMDYSYCSKMFTPGQKSRMRTALQSSVAGRNNLWTTTNLNSTGTNGAPTLCKAEFSATKTIICAGDSVFFQDETYNNVSGWNWTFNGASPATSTLQNPAVTYATPGFYTVTLTATDGSSNQTETKTAYIQVLPNAATLPFYDSFESYSTLSNINEWAVFNGGTNNTFELATNAGSSGTKSVRLINFGQTGSNTDELLSAPVDLSSFASTDVITLTFKYAYRKVNSTNTEYLKIFATNNCGDTWTIRKSISGNTLSNLTYSSSWTPTSSDWTTVHVTNITSTYFVDNFRYKFKFDGNGGNNIYLDDINMYQGAPSNTIVTNGISENKATIDFSIYPNPTDKELNVDFSVTMDQDVVFTIYDVTGKMTQTNLIKAKTGSNMVLLNTESLNAGIYMLNIKTGNSTQMTQFVVK